MIGINTRAACLFVALAVSTVACDSNAPKVPLSSMAKDSTPQLVASAHALIGPAAKAALDSGNALYRLKKYPQALAQYRLAADRAPQHAAPLFGIYMVARATSNPALADSAMAGIRLRNGPLPATTGMTAPHSMTDSALKSLRAQMKNGGKAN